MNWYKRAQLETIDRTDGSIDDYRAIGHDLYHRNQKARIDNPNYLWVYRNGMIEANPETTEQSSHSFYPQWNDVEYNKTYAGRYSPSTKTITIIRPMGVFEFREIPSNLKRLLQQKFPESQKLSIHASAQSWYKKAQQLEMEEKEQHGSHYTDYGHDIYFEEPVETYEDYKPNYMWEYVNGEIDIEEETREIASHSEVRRWRYTKSYSGRYDNGRGVITLVKPYNTIAQHREVPEILQYKLRNAFPEAKKIMVF